MNALPVAAEKRASALHCGGALEPAVFARIRRQVLLECCKWDAQIGDVCTLADFPLWLSRSEWAELTRLAEELTTELYAAERELAGNAKALGALGLPRVLHDLFREGAVTEWTPAAARTLRYDFHPTKSGWALSEVNCDVPGGFAEASGFTRYVADAVGGDPTGFPIQEWAHAITRVTGAGGDVALLSAPGYMEDFQIVSYLAEHLRQNGCSAHLAKPEQLVWARKRAHLETKWQRGPLDAVVRFYQGEWLSRLRDEGCWRPLFVGGDTPVANPGSALLGESKRFPLAWPSLRTPLRAWRNVLPETRDPREAPWKTDWSWIVKSAYCNTGDTVGCIDWTPAARWEKLARAIRRRPEQWVAQRRFDVSPVDTPHGAMFPCIGVYVIDGRVCGIYGRLSPTPVIDFTALDAAVLLTNDL